MSRNAGLPPGTRQTAETDHIEAVLKKAGFEEPKAYRYNSAVIRLRVIDPKFEGMPVERRDSMVEDVLTQLPERTQSDIITLLTFAPSELAADSDSMYLRERFLNLEFEDPGRSIL